MPQIGHSLSKDWNNKNYIYIYIYRSFFSFTDVDECHSPSTNNCSDNEVCNDIAGGYQCIPCSEDGADNLPVLPGCADVIPPDPCSKISCHNGGECEVVQGTSVRCVCPSHYTGEWTNKERDRERERHHHGQHIYVCMLISSIVAYSVVLVN